MSFGLLGEHLSHSYSQIIHNMLGAYSYDLYEISPNDLENFINEGQFSGLNVTFPYKEKVMSLVKTDPVARKLGAVNTIYYKDGVLRGTNTDYFGFMYLLSLAQINLSGKKIFVASRQKSKEYVSYNSLPVDVDIIINATPIGTYPNTDARIIDLAPFTKCEAVIDLIYNPAKTDLLLQAEKKGIKHINGLPMLVAQATKAAQYFIGMDFLQYNKPILTNLKSLTLNITLVGMPGVGKTVIGSEIAKLTGRKFVDIDKEVETIAGMSVSRIFNEYSEEYFRDLETQVLKKYAKETSLVIATGGGSVLKEENRDAIRANSFVVELKRPFDLLEKSERPLSIKATSMEDLYKERKSAYDLTKDITIENNDTIENIANIILDKVGEHYENENNNN